MVSSVLAGVDSARSLSEQQEKATRSIRGKITQAKEGTYLGGYPPYGFCVVCYAPHGSEKWRIEWLHAVKTDIRRVQLWPDGRRVSYDGPNNFPGRDEHDTLRLAPSSIVERIEYARLIWKWMDTEEISLRAVCSRLNNMKVDPVIGKAWYTSRLGPMLRNPAYREDIGATVYNKKGHGRFREWIDGDYKEVPKVKGRAKSGRKRTPDQHIYPEQGRPNQTGGIIPVDQFERVANKLAGFPAIRKAPKDSTLYLSGLVYCQGCLDGGEPGRMGGWTTKSDPKCQHSYVCATYRRYGRHHSLTGCWLHRVSQKVLEELIGCYLSELGTSLESLLEASIDPVGLGLLDSLILQQDDKQWQFLREVNRLWRAAREAGAKPPQGQAWSIQSLCESYTNLAGKHRAKIQQQLDAMDAEHSRLVESYADLPPLARDKAKVKLTELETQMEGLRGQLEPLNEKVLLLREDLARLAAGIEEARVALDSESGRHKADALGRLIRRVVCSFRHEMAGSQARSILTQVRIEPVEGADRTYALDAAPGRG
jgi:hypothetical protein